MEWVNVNDKLPMSLADMKANYEVIDVLISCADGVFSGEYKCGKTSGFWFEFCSDGMIMSSVTHWMPLPEPPKAL